MNQHIFLKKEIWEIIRSKKIYILPSVLLVFGLVSPLTARYIKEIFGSVAMDVKFEIPDPTYLDAFAQYLKNVSGIGILLILLSFAGIVVEEKVRGTAVLVLSKPLSRRTFILSKFLASAAVTTFAYLLSIAGFLYYTYLLFPGFPMGNSIMGFLMMWLYMLFIISVSLFTSTVARSYTISAVLAFGVYIVLSILSAFEPLKRYLPLTLADSMMDFAAGKPYDANLTITIAINCVITAALVFLSTEAFRRQEM